VEQSYRKSESPTCCGWTTDDSRFHATDWSTKREEFSGWSDDEKFELFDNLLALFERYNVVGCGESVYLKDVAAVFPEAGRAK